MNREQEKLNQWFQTVKFRKTLIGGINEASLWKKLEELNGLYDDAIVAERARYDALLLEQRKNAAAVLRKYKTELAKLKRQVRENHKADSGEKPTAPRPEKGERR